jgi:hypothetical protein
MMTRREANIGLISSAAIVAAGGVASAQGSDSIELPPPAARAESP